MTDTIDKKTAKALGLKRFFTGVPCDKNHTDERYVANGQCAQCVRDRVNAASKKKHAESAMAAGFDPGRPGRRPKYKTQEERLEARRAGSRKFRQVHREAYLADHNDRMKRRTRDHAIAEGRVPGFLGYKARWTVEQHALYERDMADGGRIFQGRVRGQNARAKRLGIEGKFTVRDVLNIYAEQEGCCGYCHRPLGDEIPDIDHWIPITRGGTNWPDNIKLLHRACNQSKNDRLPSELLAIFADPQPLPDEPLPDDSLGTDERYSEDEEFFGAAYRAIVMSDLLHYDMLHRAQGVQLS